MAPTKPTYRSPSVLWSRSTWSAKGTGIDVERYDTFIETEGWWGEERGGSGIGEKEGSFDRLDGHSHSWSLWFKLEYECTTSKFMLAGSARPAYSRPS